MSEAATRWISPFWGSVRTPAEAGSPSKLLGRAEVYVLNLGEQGKVILKWFNVFGHVGKQQEHSPELYRTDIFYAPEDFYGWLRIESTSPVIPWGITPV